MRVELLPFLLLVLLDLIVPFTSGKSDGVCVSPGGRFPPFANEGKPPRRVTRGTKDLTLCRVFRKKTCCDVAQTHPALLSVRKLGSTGEASPECLQLWELLECSICDPNVGVKPGPPRICVSLCDRVYKACSYAYFSMDAKTQVLAPCGVNDFVCGRASEWISNGTDLCHAAGYAVEPSDDMEETSCYGGKASLAVIANSWQSSQSDMPQKGESSGMWEDFRQILREMPLSERVSWAVGGMVLTAGLLFVSKRKSHSQRQKQAAIQRTARKLESKINQKPAVTRGNRKSVGR
ncbi:hypothetical protein NMG60_11032247 [Bertholletia excelsa]